MLQKITHKGWYLFCPVYLGGINTESPYVQVRWWFLYPLFLIAHIVQSIIILLCSLVYLDYEPQFYFMITGELHGNNPTRHQ